VHNYFEAENIHAEHVEMDSFVVRKFLKWQVADEDWSIVSVCFQNYLAAAAVAVEVVAAAVVSFVAANAFVDAIVAAAF